MLSSSLLVCQFTECLLAQLKNKKLKYKCKILSCKGFGEILNFINRVCGQMHKMLIFDG